MLVMKVDIDTTSFYVQPRVKRKYGVTLIRKMQSQQATCENIQNSAGVLMQSRQLVEQRMQRRLAILSSNHWQKMD